MKQGFFESYTKAYERVVSRSGLSVYGELMDMHHDVLEDKHRILESGCGPGNFAIELLEHGHEVHAVDKNSVALNRLKSKSKGYEGKLKIYCQDVNNLTFGSGFFDGISSMLVLPFMNSPVEYIKEHERVMKPGGIMVVSGPDTRAKNEIDWMMMQWKEDIIGQGMWDELKNDWEQMERYTRQNVDSNVKNWFSLDEVSGMMKKQIGMRIIQKLPNPMYYSMGYVITAEKKD